MKYNNHPGNLFWSNIFCTNKHHQNLTRWPWEILIKLRWEWMFQAGRSRAWSISCELALRWMSLVGKQWFRWWLKSWQATGHYLSQCRPRLVLPYGVTQWPKFGIISIKCKVPQYDRVYQTNGIYFHNQSVYSQGRNPHANNPGVMLIHTGTFSEWLLPSDNWNGHFDDGISGARLTKAYDITIQDIINRTQ